MKRSILHFTLFFVSLTCICGMCSKSDSGGDAPPIELEHSKGFLVTTAILNNGNEDSVCLRYGPAEPVTEYGARSVSGGFIQRPKHTWEIINSGTNHWYFKYNDGRYLGYKYDEFGVGDTRFRVTLDDAPGENNLFVINKKDNKFVIQPVANKSVYLNTVQVDVQPPSPRHGFVRYKEGKQQFWFIMP